MDQKLNRVTVTIYGEEYTVRGTEKTEHIEAAARLVDERMKELGGRLPQLSLSRIAVLTALNLADEVLKLEDKNARLTGMLEKEWEKRKEELARARAAELAESAPENRGEDKSADADEQGPAQSPNNHVESRNLDRATGETDGV